MKFQIGNLDSLSSAIDFSDNEIIFLIGSALSCSYNETIGIPGVREMLELIDDKVSERKKTRELYLESMGKFTSDTEKYQAVNSDNKCNAHGA